MKVICDYCEAYIESTDEKCPNCGAPNTHFARTASDSPKTIEQLKEFCEKKNLPLEKMHVHIGEDYPDPKAFGIYKNANTGRFIVYKNKADGTRAVRYEGTDEAYAVNEIYMKIKDLILDARTHSAPTQQSTTSIPNTYRTPENFNWKTYKEHKKINWKKLGIIIAVLAALWYIGTLMGGKTGYYKQNDNLYYRHGSHWYALENGVWDRTSDEIDDDYYIGDSYYSDDDPSFKEFPEYVFNDDWSTNDDWDSDDDYSWSSSYDDYDYGSSYDWDSDW
ncbi:MAG: hypothetical protein J5857_01130 [Treponema sp.]|nr:hypothetical protein [Treponema sp.]